MNTGTQLDGDRKPTANVRMHSDTLNELLAESLRRKVETGRKPSIAELITEAWRIYKTRRAEKAA